MQPPCWRAAGPDQRDPDRGRTVRKAPARTV